MTWDRVEGAIGIPADFAGVTGLAGWHDGSVGQLSAAVVDGALRIRWHLDVSVPEDEANRLADALGTVLGEITEHCRGAAEGSYEPSDFPWPICPDTNWTNSSTNCGDWRQRRTGL
ncbi:hypothetical protein V6574_28750 [Streptomyces sp. SM1P]